MDCEVLVSGCFQIVHAGHCELFEFASQFGKVTVAINADSYLERKYNGRVVPLLNRAYVLKCNKYIDKVVVFPEDHPGKLIRRLKPDIYVRGPDYAGAELPEQDSLDEIGCRLVIHHTSKISDSSKLIKDVHPKIFQELAGLKSIIDL